MLVRARTLKLTGHVVNASRVITAFITIRSMMFGNVISVVRGLAEIGKRSSDTIKSSCAVKVTDVNRKSD